MPERSLSTHAAGGITSPVGFAAAPTLPTGFLPTAIVNGDFNEDGKTDVAVSNGGDNSIYVYLGNGDGSFKIPEILYTSGESPVWLLAAKLRTGGHLDLIVADGDSNQIEVFLGNGDGGFQASAVTSLPQAPSFLVSGDFNKDGVTDIAVGLVIAAFSSGNQLAILPGNGAGGFSQAILAPSPSGVGGASVASWMAAGDLNGDGFPDLVLSLSSGNSVAYLNQAGTSFQPGATFGPADGSAATALADTNNDGCLDAIEAGAAGFLTIATGNCDGTFTQHAAVANLGDVDVALLVADVNGDGKPDVVGSSAFSPGAADNGTYGGYLVSVLAGTSSGGFSAPALYRVGSQAYGLTIADLKGNGKPDILAVSQRESTASDLANDGNGGFGGPAGETVGYLNGPWAAAIPNGPVETVDLNGDGKQDVLLVESGMNPTGPTQMTSLLSQGGGALAAPVQSSMSAGPVALFTLISAGNFRNATVADVIYADQYSSPSVVAFMRGNGDGTFAAPVTLGNVPNPYAITSGDFNLDGKLDFAIWGTGSGSSEEVDVFLGKGDGIFTQIAAQTFTSLAGANDLPIQLLAADMNHDGKLDLLIGYNTNSGWVVSGDDLQVALGNGDGTFQPVATLMAHFGPVAIGDLNHDGYVDLIQSRDPAADVTQQALDAGGGPYISAAVTVYLGGANGKFTQQPTYYAPGVQVPEYSGALVGDFNGDSNLDVALPYIQATGTAWERRLQLFQGMGDGSLAASGIPFQLPDYDLPIVGGDYRGLGVTDLLDVVTSTNAVTTVSATPSPALAITPEGSPLTGNTGSATVTLALPATTSQTVQLSASDPAVQLPSSVTFSAGQQQQSFSFTVGAVFDYSHLLAINATLGAQTATTYFAAKPNANLTPGVNALIGESAPGTTTAGISPGDSIPLLFTLQSVHGYSGIFGNFACSGLPAGAACDFPTSSMTLLPGGSAQVAFTLSADASALGGTFNISVTAGNGALTASAPLTLGIGGFTVSLQPAFLVIDGVGAANATASANYTNDYSQSVQLGCAGLPTGVTCVIPGVVYPASRSDTITIVAGTSLPAQDYPFTLTGTAGNLTSTFNATLRVSNFTAALQSNAGSVMSGHSVAFNILLTSVNHFSNGNISIACQAPATVTCATQNEYYSLSDGGTTTLALNVGYVTSQSSAKPDVGARNWLPALLIPGLLFSWRRRRRALWTAVYAFVAATVLASSFTGCGGSGSGSGGGGGTTPPGGTTPAAQTISVVVTAQANTDSGNVQQSAGTIVLTAQP